MSLLLLFWPPNQPAPASAEVVNLNVVERDLWAALNASGPADAMFWTQAEIYQWFDEAAQRLARTIGVFVVRDTSLTSVANQASYNLPAAQVSTIQADHGGFVLRARNVQELEALDAAWPATTGKPVAFIQDTQGFNHIVLYPIANNANAGKAIGLVMHVVLSTITQSAAIIAMPTVMQDYFRYYALAEARSKETKAAMPEVSAWLRQLTGMYEKIADQYWGAAQ